MCEEIRIYDYEGFGGYSVGEYEGIQSFSFVGDCENSRRQALLRLGG